MNRLDLDAVWKKSGRSGTYIGAVSVLPFIIIVIGAIIYATMWLWGVEIPSRIALLLRSPVLIGSLPLLFAWLLFAVVNFLFISIQNTNNQSYNSFLKRFYRFNVRLQLLDVDLHIESGISSEWGTAHKIVTEGTATGHEMQSFDALIPDFNKIEAYLYRNIIYNKLMGKNISWVQTNDNMNLWKILQLGEEALIEISPRTDVIREALHDRACMKNSNIKNSNELINKLTQATRVLDALNEENLTEPSYYQRSFTQEDSTSTQTSSANIAAEAQARAILRAVRHALNQFRNSRWEAIIQTRNYIIYAIVIIGIIIYILVDFVIIINIPRSLIIVGMGFFLVGAIAGLLGRLYNESRASRSTPDYGLAIALMVITPIISGIVAVAGVAAVQQGNLFNSEHLLLGLVVAIICGIISNSFMNTVHKGAEQYKTDLKSLQPKICSEQVEGLLSVNEPRSLLSRIAYRELEQGIVIRGPKIIATQPSLLENVRTKLQEVVRWQRTKEIELALNAITRIDLEEGNIAFVNKTYSLEAGMSLNKSEISNDKSSDRLRDVSIDDPIEFDVLFHGSENIGLTHVTEWHKLFLYKPYKPESQFVEFTFQVIEPGHSSVVIDFFYEQRWLKTIYFEFDANENPN
jgi:hypothetical protein